MSGVASIFFWPQRAPGKVWGWLGAAAADAAVLMRLGERLQARSIHQWVPPLPPPQLRHITPAASTLPVPPRLDRTLGKHPPTSFFPAATSNLSLLPSNHPPPTYKTVTVRNALFPSPFPPHRSVLLSG